MAMQKKNIINEFMADLDLIPSENQAIVKYVSGKGNNLHEVEKPGLGPNSPSTFFLVSMPKKFRQLVWLRKGDCIVIDPIAEGKKVRGEIMCILPLKSVLNLVEKGQWPPLKYQNITTEGTDLIDGSQNLKTHLRNFFCAGLAKWKFSSDSSITSSEIISDSEDNSESSATTSEDEEDDAIDEDADTTGTVPVIQI